MGGASGVGEFQAAAGRGDEDRGRTGGGEPGGKRRRLAGGGGDLRRRIDQAAKQRSAPLALEAFRDAKAARAAVAAAPPEGVSPGRAAAPPPPPPPLPSPPQLNTHTCNVLLHLCAGGDGWDQHLLCGSEAGDGEGGVQEALGVVPEVVQYMQQLKIPYTEMTMTAMARAAAAEGHPERSLELVEEAAERFEAGEAELQPRLRTFTPALLGFCAQDDLQGMARVVRQLAGFSAKHDLEIILTEAELGQMLAACVRARDKGAVSEVTAMADKVLEEMMENLSTLSESTLGLLQTWFEGDRDGAWEIRRGTVNLDGECSCCSVRLRAIDLDGPQFKAFSAGITKLASQRERSNSSKKKGGEAGEPKVSQFEQFSQWLERKGPFDVVIDGANVAMYGQAKENHMQPRQISQVVQQIQKEQPDSRVLVVLHNRRVNQLRQSRQGKKVLEQLLRTGVLYATPTGSNDDWYWMHAVVQAGPRGLLISNDQMRDHIFQLLSPKFFPKWRARHQVTFEFWDNHLTFERPAKFSTCIQRDVPTAADGEQAAEALGWHFPPSETQEWLCVRPRRH